MMKPFSPNLEHFIQQELASGRYPNRESLIEQALVLLSQRTLGENSGYADPRSPAASTSQNFPLAGTVLHYDDPFAPAISPEDGDALA